VTNEILAIGPNKRAVEAAKDYLYVPREARYIGQTQALRGYDQPVVFVVNFGPRPNQVYSWGNRSQQLRKESMMRELVPARAQIVEVRLP